MTKQNRYFERLLNFLMKIVLYEVAETTGWLLCVQLVCRYLEIQYFPVFTKISIAKLPNDWTCFVEPKFKSPSQEFGVTGSMLFTNIKSKELHKIWTFKGNWPSKTVTVNDGFYCIDYLYGTVLVINAEAMLRK